MRICTLASGSSGNCLYIESGETRILVDAGISLRQIVLKLRKLDVELSDIDAVIVTHEHSDHTAALQNIGVPVHVARATTHLWANKVSSLREFDTDASFMIRDMLITPFSVPHDALDPVGFSIESGQGKKIGVVTDIGSVTALVRERLRGSNALVIEFNHDNDILLYSHYPWDLKQRIRGRLGHLSNNQASELLSDLVHGGLRHVVLAHLSQVNNRPEVAFESASSALRKNGQASGVQISVAPRKTLGEVLSI
ncbi:MAG: MBL fold metallo-hydrolase [Thermodesulfobacteriota bacterium]